MPRADYLIADGGRGGGGGGAFQFQQQQPSFSSSGSIRDVNYSCGSCGYELNLNSSNRNTAGIGSKYRKSLKKGTISFTCIDESRFTQIDENQCVPYIFSKCSWGLLKPKTKLLCGKCGNYIGEAYSDKTSLNFQSVDDLDSSHTRSGGKCVRYNIRIRSLQPSSGNGTPFVY